ncbi:hypothetical protein BaRGS_00029473, partial [Batillaria attramentaria]
SKDPFTFGSRSLSASSTTIGQILDNHFWVYHPRLSDINDFMSTRSGRRRHPYRRTRHAGSVSGGLAIGQNRRRRQPAATQTTMDGDPDPGSCIDLTANDTLDDDVIDLTQSSGGGRNRSAIESPVVVISPVDVDNADSFSRRLSARQGLRASQDDSGDDVIDVEREATPESSGGATRSNSTIDVDNLSDDDSDLPAVPFSVTESSSALSSSEGSKITCPVCMDSDAQV